MRSVVALACLESCCLPFLIVPSIRRLLLSLALFVRRRSRPTSWSSSWFCCCFALRSGRLPFKGDLLSACLSEVSIGTDAEREMFDASTVGYERINICGQAMPLRLTDCGRPFITFVIVKVVCLCHALSVVHKYRASRAPRANVRCCQVIKIFRDL